jgi:hypothetical protein
MYMPDAFQEASSDPDMMVCAHHQVKRVWLLISSASILSSVRDGATRRETVIFSLIAICLSFLAFIAICIQVGKVSNVKWS